MPQNGVTPLMAAAGKGHAAVVKLLLEAGAKIDQADKVSGDTYNAMRTLMSVSIRERGILFCAVSMETSV